MKYRRLKTLDSTGVPILRYYRLASGEEAVANAFYGLTNGEASRIEGTVGDGVTIIGFSHGGDNLARKLIFLDVNETVLYMAILGEDEEDRPKIGEVVNGYQKVIDTHYEDESEAGKNNEKWGIEYLDVPYYIFKIVQPEGSEYASEVDDSDSGEVMPQPNPEHDPLSYAVISVITEDGTGILKYTPKGGEATTATLTYGGTPFKTAFVARAGDALSTIYDAIAMYDDTGENLVVDLVNLTITGETIINVAVPVDGGERVTEDNPGAGVGGDVTPIGNDPVLNP